MWQFVRFVRPGRCRPFGLPLPEGNGILWEDPREIHKVIVHFSGAVTAPEKIHLEVLGQPLAATTSAQKIVSRAAPTSVG